MIKIQIDGWRKAKGFGRVIQEDFGMNISTAILTKEVSQSDVITVGEKKEDELTGLPWEEVNLALWMKKESMVDNFDQSGTQRVKRTNLTVQRVTHSQMKLTSALTVGQACQMA